MRDRQVGRTSNGLQVTGIDQQFSDVLAAAQANGGWAYEWLFQTFSPRVRGYLRSQGSEEPDELTNDVFLSAFRALSRFEGDETRFRSWLFTIARNRLIDERRREERRVTAVPTDISVLHERAGGDVETEALDNISDVWVYETMRNLAPDQRDVLLLRVVGDLTVDQISQVIGKRPGAVKALQRRGLAAVKRLLDRQGVPLERSDDVVKD